MTQNPPHPIDVESPLVRRAIDRSIQNRLTTTTGEVRSLVDAAVRVVARHGSMDAPLREILREAGLSTPAMYRHFQSKDELMLIVLDEGARILTSYVERRMGQQASSVSKIQAWIEGVLHQAEEPRAAEITRPFSLGSGELFSRFPEEQRLVEWVLVAPLERAIIAAVEADLCQSENPATDALSIHDFTIAWQRRHLYQRSVPRPETIAHIVGFALRALGVDPDGLDPVRSGRAEERP